jgi:transcriptional regulator with XRE-family HTH domain
MNDRSNLISRLISERDFRADYIRAKLDVLIPSQLRGLRRRNDLTQPQLAEMAGMKQARISAMETQGRVNFNRETLVRMAATYGVGLIVKFVPFSEMLKWENDYSQDIFVVAKIEDDDEFLNPPFERKHNDIATVRNGDRQAITEDQPYQKASGGISNGARAAAA